MISQPKRNYSPIILGALVVVLASTAYVFTMQKPEGGQESAGLASPTPTTLATPQSSPLSAESEIAERSGVTITSAESDFGQMLFDGNNQAIYIWEKEDTSTPECYDDCAVAWPPVLTEGTPIASGNVQNELLGTVMRSDGSTQVTYNGHPLYYYADEGPGEVKCHNVATHGGLWWVIQPSGIRAD